MSDRFVTESGRTVRRVFVVSPGNLAVEAPIGREAWVDWRFFDAAAFARVPLDVPRDEPPDLWVGLNVPPPRAERARLGTLEIRADLGIPATGEQSRRKPVIVSNIGWTAEGRSDPVLLEQVVAPIYPADTWRDVRARGEELGLCLLRRTVTRILRDGGFQGEVGDAASAPQHPVRALTASERLRWFLGQLVRRVVRRLHPRRLLKLALLVSALLVVRPIRDRVRSLRRRHPVRIFTFHRVTELCRDSLTASRRTFREQLRYIRGSHRVVEIGEALRLLASGAALDRPVAVITFDDAYRSVHDFAAPVMAELGLPGCCFVPTAYVDTADRFPWDRESPVVSFLQVMDWEELVDLRARGWTIGGHSATHRRLADCEVSSLRRELQEPLDTLYQRLAIEGIPMAYPFGGPNDVDESGLRLVEALGYSACFSNYGGENFPPASPYRLCRIDIGGDLEALIWKGRVHGIEPGRWRRNG